MEDSHYVLLVHGTWTDTPGWHKFDEHQPNNFASRLSALLSKRGMPGIIEKSVNATSRHFSWSGANDHKARLEAAESLAIHIRNICENDPLARVHIVAHSHGCNVVLKAVETYLNEIIGAANEIWMKLLLPIMDRAELLEQDKSFPELLRSAFPDKDDDYFRGYSEAFKILASEVEKRRHRHGITAVDSGMSTLFGSEYTKFLHAWLISKNTLPLGRLIFLGPPFLKKFWISQSAFTRRAIKVGDFLLGLIMGLLAIYTFSLVLWTLAWLADYTLSEILSISPLRSPDLNPLNWNIWLLIVSGFISVMSGVLGGLVAADTSRRVNTNFYFDRLAVHFSRRARKKSSDAECSEEAESSKKNESSYFPLPCLTITAELLDEVILGFSSAPIVYGALLPQLENIGRPNFSMHLPPVPLGHEPGMIENLGSVLRRSKIGLGKL